MNSRSAMPKPGWVAFYPADRVQLNPRRPADPPTGGRVQAAFLSMRSRSYPHSPDAPIPWGLPLPKAFSPSGSRRA